MIAMMVNRKNKLGVLDCWLDKICNFLFFCFVLLNFCAFEILIGATLIIAKMLTETVSKITLFAVVHPNYCLPFVWTYSEYVNVCIV